MLEIKKTIKLKGLIKQEGETVKEMTADIDSTATTAYVEYVYDKNLYAKYRKDNRKLEQDFQNKIYEVEDEILTEKEV